MVPVNIPANADQVNQEGGHGDGEKNRPQPRVRVDEGEVGEAQGTQADDEQLASQGPVVQKGDGQG